MAWKGGQCMARRGAALVVEAEGGLVRGGDEAVAEAAARLVEVRDGLLDRKAKHAKGIGDAASEAAAGRVVERGEADALVARRLDGVAQAAARGRDDLVVASHVLRDAERAARPRLARDVHEEGLWIDGADREARV
jgi:hypothetical protein